MKITLAFILTLLSQTLFSQINYADSITNFIRDYVSHHEVVTGEDRKNLHFFEPDTAYVTDATIEKKTNGAWFQMATSGPIKKWYRIYGTLHFQIQGKALQLNLYQSQDLMGTPGYQNYLFLPFTDLTSGKETYASGRYIDLKTDDFHNGHVRIDFNKAYNPYCAYVNGVYNCPIPPGENQLPIAVTAGEKNYTGSH